MNGLVESDWLVTHVPLWSWLTRFSRSTRIRDQCNWRFVGTLVTHLCERQPIKVSQLSLLKIDWFSFLVSRSLISDTQPKHYATLKLMNNKQKSSASQCPSTFPKTLQIECLITHDSLTSAPTRKRKVRMKFNRFAHWDMKLFFFFSFRDSTCFASSYSRRKKKLILITKLESKTFIILLLLHSFCL